MNREQPDADHRQHRTNRHPASLYAQSTSTNRRPPHSNQQAKRANPRPLPANQRQDDRNQPQGADNQKSAARNHRQLGHNRKSDRGNRLLSLPNRNPHHLYRQTRAGTPCRRCFTPRATPQSDELVELVVQVLEHTACCDLVILRSFQHEEIRREDRRAHVGVKAGAFSHAPRAANSARYRSGTDQPSRIPRRARMPARSAVATTSASWTST